MYARGALGVCAVALVAASASGCIQFGGSVPRDASAGLFEEAAISYRVDAGKEGLAMAAARIEGQLVSYDQVPSTPRSDHSVGRLTLQYPHPRGVDGMALARVEINSKWHTTPDGEVQTVDQSALSTRLTTALAEGKWPGKTTAGELHESWELDIPKAQLDRIVADLNGAGYFGKQRKSKSGIELAARIDGGQVTKAWEQVPELDLLMRRVRSEGQLIAYHRTPGVKKPGEHAFSSVAAYQALGHNANPHAVAQGAMPMTPANGYVATGPGADHGAWPATASYVAPAGAAYPSTGAPVPHFAHLHGLAQPTTPAEPHYPPQPQPALPTQRY